MKKFIILFLFCQFSWAQQYNLTEAEYFWGQIDPGYGQGIGLSTTDGMFDAAVENIITTYTVTQTQPGPTLFNIRVKDAQGNFGPVFKKVIFIGGATETAQQIKVTGFEYYFGNFDPGEGNGTTIVAFDGALDNAVEDVFRNQVTWNVGTGPILFNIRGRDADGLWGPVFKKTVFPFGENANAELIAEGDTLEVCPNTSVTLTYNGPFGYTPTWFDGTQENTITFTPTEEGPVTCSAQLGNSTYTDTIDIVFKPLPNATINETGTLLVCASSNFTLVANTDANFSYQWYLNDNLITNATNASYLPTALGSYAVEITDENSGCSKISEPTILTTSFTTTPSGNVNFCQEQLLSVPLGSSNTYQWQKNGEDISGATLNSYLASEEGDYLCIITNGNCSVTTSTTTLNLATDLPTGDTEQSFVVGSTLNDLIINGTNLQWYANITDANPIASNTTLINNTTYYVSQTINGCESNRLAITVTETLGLDDTFLADLTIYPNPTSQNITIDFGTITDITNWHIKIYNTLGQQLFTTAVNSQKHEVALSTFVSAGIYFIKVYNASNNVVNTKKIVLR